MPGVVTVASKLPHGLHLRVFHFEEHPEPIMGGGTRVVKRAVYDRRVTIKGNARRYDDPRMSFGYALTHNVDADLWAEWLAQNKDSDMVRNHMIFAHAKTDEAKAMAKGGEVLRSGFEEIDPNNIPAEFKGRIEKADKPSSARA